MRPLHYVIVLGAALILLPTAVWLGLAQSSDRDPKEAEHAAASAELEKAIAEAESVTEVPTSKPSPGGAAQTKKQREQAEKLAGAVEARAKEAAEPKPFSLRISTFNVLGSQHTRPGAQRSGMAPGRVRAGWAADMISRAGADIVGLAELQRDQYGVLMSRMPDFTAYPGLSLGSPGLPASVIWRTSRFELISTSHLSIQKMGQVRPMPVVLLEDKATERQFFVMNVHNSPVQGSDKSSRQGERNVQMAAEIALINKLRATGRPVFLTGDMNEHAEVFCKVTGATDLTSPAGGSSAGGCRPPGRMRVDWIFGNGQWTSYQINRDAMARRTTDHAVLFADVTVE